MTDTSDTIQKIADGLDGLAAVIRKYGTCAPAALDELANRLRALSARASAGEGGEWVMVPREPTPEMIEAGSFYATTMAGAWRAMLAAAPQPQEAAPVRKPSECADGCPPLQVCDHCQQPSEAVWLMPVATQEPGDSRLLQFAWGRSNLSTGQMAHAYDCIVAAAKACGQTFTPTPADESGKEPAGHQPPPADIGPYPSPVAVARKTEYDRELIARMLEMEPGTYTSEAIAQQIRLLREADNAESAGVHTARLTPASSGDDTARLDFIERTFSGMTNRERYLPVQMVWGKGCNGRTLREACDKYMKRDTALALPAQGEGKECENCGADDHDGRCEDSP